MQDNSTEKSDKLDDLPSSPARSTDDEQVNRYVPQETVVSKYRTAGFDGGSIYGQRREQRIRPPTYSHGRLHDGRDEQGRRYLRRNGYDRHGRVSTRSLGELYGEARRTPAVDPKQPRTAVFDRTRSNQRSYEDTIYEHMYDRRPSDARLDGGVHLSTGGGSRVGSYRRPVDGYRATNNAAVLKGTFTFSPRSNLSELDIAVTVLLSRSYTALAQLWTNVWTVCNIELYGSTQLMGKVNFNKHKTITVYTKTYCMLSHFC